MKKIIFVVTISICSVFSVYSQIQTPNSEISQRAVRIADIREPFSFLEDMNYIDIKRRIISDDFKAISLEKIYDVAESIDEEKPNIKAYENLVLSIYSLSNKDLSDLYQHSRLLNQERNEELDKMSNKYFEIVEDTFHENALLVQLNPNNQEKLNSIAKLSFSTIIDNIIDYAECLVCCPKTSFPDERWFLLKPKTGKSIVAQKAEYSSWYSHKLCGFMIYNFPCTFFKARFKLNFKGTLLWLLNGTPRFKDLAPNGKAVHVSLLPAIITLGIRDISTPPCRNEKLHYELMQLVQVKCK